LGVERPGLPVQRVKHGAIRMPLGGASPKLHSRWNS
jgi:hypothetical protein